MERNKQLFPEQHLAETGETDVDVSPDISITYKAAETDFSEEAKIFFADHYGCYKEDFSDSEALIATDPHSGTIIGIIGFINSSRFKVMLIERIAVAKELRRRGIGTELLMQAVRHYRTAPDYTVDRIPMTEPGLAFIRATNQSVEKLVRGEN